MNINKELLKYIEDNIFPEYEKNDNAHGIEHIKYVIERSVKFAKTIPNINYDMVYTIAAYHDIGHHIDAKNHERISSEILRDDKKLKEYFNEEEISIMVDAVHDHRASSDTEPRNIYGKIVSSADRNTSIDNILKRTYAYILKHNPNLNNKEIIEDSKKHIISKFGKKGYATEKMYFEDKEYMKFLSDVEELVQNEKEFTKRYCEVNNISIED